MKHVFTVLFCIVLVCFNSNAQTLTVSKISFDGLKKTKEKVINVELSFQVGSQVNRQDLDSILKNNNVRLYNLQLFHWVKSKYEIENDQVAVTFLFQERWYLWPIPIFSLADRNLNAWLQKMDFRRIDYGLHVVQNNFMGRNQTVKTNIQEGFNKKYEVFYRVPYLDKKQLLGLDLAVSHYKSRFLDFGLQAGNPLVIETPNDFAVKNNYIRAQVFRRKNVEIVSHLGAEVRSIQYNDTVHQLNPNYFLNNNGKSATHLGISFSHTINRRHTFSYPKKGYFLDGRITQRIGLNNNSSLMTDIQVEGAKYLPLSNKLFFTTGLTGNYKLSNTNYFVDNFALGYKKFVRGYELYVTNGNAWFLQKNGLNLALFEDKQLKFDFVNASKFNTIPISIYLSMYADFGYVHDPVNQTDNLLANELLVGAGLGLHIVSYYDRVLVLEYSFNKLGEKGFFLSTTFPI